MPRESQRPLRKVQKVVKGVTGGGGGDNWGRWLSLESESPQMSAESQQQTFLLPLGDECLVPGGGIRVTPCTYPQRQAHVHASWLRLSFPAVPSCPWEEHILGEG